MDATLPLSFTVITHCDNIVLLTAATTTCPVSITLTIAATATIATTAPGKKKARNNKIHTEGTNPNHKKFAMQVDTIMVNLQYR